MKISFIIYCLVEILRIAYMDGFKILPLRVGLSMFGIVIIIRFQKFLLKNKTIISKSKWLFLSKPNKVVMAFHIASIALILSAVLVLAVDFPSFLIVQLLLLAILWKDNRGLQINLNMLRISFIFTVIYMSYILLITKNIFVGFVFFVYFISWLYLQVKLDQLALREDTSTTIEK